MSRHRGQFAGREDRNDCTTILQQNFKKDGAELNDVV